MKAPSTKHLLSPLLALIRITPPPTSTIYTSALLTKLQTFGSVLEFRPVTSPTGTSPSDHHHHHHLPSTPAPASRTLYAVRFGTSTALERALAASPLSITVSPSSKDVNTPPTNTHDHDHQQQKQQPSAATPLDPYDVLQRQTRPQHRAGVFSCSVSPLTDHQHQKWQQQQRQRLVPYRGTTALHDALIDSGAPASLAVGLSLRPTIDLDSEAETDDAHGGRDPRWKQQLKQLLEGVEQRPSGAKVSTTPSRPLRLMDLYRAVVAREDSTSKTVG